VTHRSVRKKIGLWLLAARPKTLVASIIPVSLGVSLAFQQSKHISFDLIVMCFLFSILVQIATNFANDYFDSLTGADEERTLGPKRFSNQGIIKGVHLRNVSYALLLFAFALGVFMMEKSGASRWLLFIGLASVLCALAYTGGPFPFAYNGLGDVFVILFFGFVAVSTTHYVLITDTGGLWKPNWVVPLGVGFIINNLLVVNNYRDRITDQKVGKNTIIVLFGKRLGIALYFCGFLIPSVCCPLLDNRLNLAVLLFPVGLFLVYKLSKAKTKTEFSFLLTCSSISVLVYGSIIAGSIMTKQ
jgi:1,4-dihydroxy-2-naphthoate octaprenyltransferase